MSSEEKAGRPPVTEAEKIAPQASLWTDFLRRNLLLASLAGAGALRPPREEQGREEPPPG